MQHLKCASPSALTAAREIGCGSIFASVHHLVRNRTDEAHVYSEAESKVLVPCIVSIQTTPLKSLSSSASKDSAVIAVHNTVVSQIEGRE